MPWSHLTLACFLPLRGWESQSEASERQGAAAHAAERSGAHGTLQESLSSLQGHPCSSYFLASLSASLHPGRHFSCPVGSIPRVVFRHKPLWLWLIGEEVDASVIWGALPGNDAQEGPQWRVLIQLHARRHLKGKTSASEGLQSKDRGLDGDLGRSSLCLPAPLFACV